LISLVLLVLGLYLLGRDAATMLAGSGLDPEALETLWRRLDAASLQAVQTLAQQHLPRGVWHPGITALLRLPTWALPLATGGLLMFLNLFSQVRVGEATQ
jgi:hypothetical protein